MKLLRHLLIVLVCAISLCLISIPDPAKAQSSEAEIITQMQGIKTILTNAGIKQFTYNGKDNCYVEDYHDPSGYHNPYHGAETYCYNCGFLISPNYKDNPEAYKRTIMPSAPYPLYTGSTVAEKAFHQCGTCMAYAYWLFYNLFDQSPFNIELRESPGIANARAGDYIQLFTGYDANGNPCYHYGIFYGWINSTTFQMYDGNHYMDRAIHYADESFSIYDVRAVYRAKNNVRMITNAGKKLTVNFENGNVSGASNNAFYSKDTTFTLTATPNDGYIFAGWQSTAGTFSDSTSATTMFTMPDKDTTITAVFIRDLLAVAANWSNLNSSVTSSDVALGATFTIDKPALVSWPSVDFYVCLSTTKSDLSLSPFDNTSPAYVKHITYLPKSDNGNVRTYALTLNTITDFKKINGETLLPTTGSTYYYRWICQVNSKVIMSDIQSITMPTPSSAWCEVGTNILGRSLFVGRVKYSKNVNITKVGIVVDSDRNKVANASASQSSCQYNFYDTVVTDYGVYDASNYYIENYWGENRFSFTPGVTYYYKFFCQTNDGGTSYSNIISYKTNAAAATYTFTINAGTGGKITAGSSGSYAAGNQINVSATPNAGYSFAGWTVSAGSVASNTSVTTFTMPASAATLTATFKQNNYSLTVKTVEHCSVNSNVNGTAYHFGDSIQISATPATGYLFAGWTSNNGGTFGNSKSASTTFVMPSGNVELTPVVEQVPQGTLQVTEYLNGVPLKENSNPCGKVNLKINGDLYRSNISGSFSESFAVGTTYEIVSVSATDGFRYNGLNNGSLTGTIIANGNQVGLNYSSGDWIYVTSLPSEVTSHPDQYDIEYRKQAAQVSATSPGSGWEKGAVASQQYVNSGSPYETLFEETTSNTKELVRYFYFHYCVAGSSSASYTTEKNYVHYDSIQDPNSVTIKQTLTDTTDSRIKGYHLLWKNGSYAYCSSGTTCDGSAGSHGARSYVWYRKYVYQNKVLETKYNWTYDTGWTKEKPADYTSVRYKKVAPTIKVSSLSFAPSSASVSLVKGSYSLPVTVSPSNASNKQLTWTSSNTAYATVQNGTVTLLKPGKVTITAKTCDGSNLSATFSLEITPILVESLKLSQTTLTMNMGECKQFPAYTISPSNASNRNVVWSSNSSVVSVQNGYIYAAAPGTCTLMVATQDGTLKTDTCTVTVKKSDDWIVLQDDKLPIECSDPALFEIEYKTFYQTNSVQSPGSDWTKGSLVSSKYVNVGSVYEDYHELPVSNTRQLVGYYYYHWCTRAAGVSNNYTSPVNYAYTADKYIHKDIFESANLNSVTVDSTLKDSADPNVTVYVLRWNGGAVVACKGGETCHNGDTHDYGSKYWYKMNQYQDKKLEETYSWTKETAWSGTKGTGSGIVKTQVRYKPRYIPVSKITLDETDVKLSLNCAEYSLMWEVEPANATNKDVVWSVSDTSVATMDRNTVVFQKPGTVTVTCTSLDNEQIKATCKVTILPILAEKITLSTTAKSVLLSEKTFQLSASVSPEKVTNPGVTWSSNNPAIATVNTTGNVTLVSPGECVILCTAADGSNVSAQCRLTVLPVLTSEIILSESTVTLPITLASYKLESVVLPENVTDPSVSWSSSNEQIATVRDGIVTLLSPGTVTITCSANDKSGVKAFCTLTIEEKLVTDICFDSTVLELSIRENEKTLGVRIEPSDATNQHVTWDSSDESVATVNDGVVTLHAPGVAVITCTATDKSQVSSSCTLIVNGNNIFDLPEQTETVEEGAFTGIGADTVILNNNITALGANAFANCENLRLVYAPSSLISIADNAFNGCEKITFVCDSYCYAAYYATMHDIPVVIR